MAALPDSSQLRTTLTGLLAAAGLDGLRPAPARRPVKPQRDRVSVSPAARARFEALVTAAIDAALAAATAAPAAPAGSPPAPPGREPLPDNPYLQAARDFGCGPRAGANDTSPL